jgi:hypothetical protein
MFRKVKRGRDFQQDARPLWAKWARYRANGSALLEIAQPECLRVGLTYGGDYVGESSFVERERRGWSGADSDFPCFDRSNHLE